jgi:mannose-6-phosphate isomerase-like protein (cupin superfamily)
MCPTRSHRTAPKCACCANYRAAASRYFRCRPNAVSKAVAHRTVEEVWYVSSGRGRMWRKLGDDEQIVELAPGISLTIPTGTYFQFRCDGEERLDVIGATMPPWPGEGEAFFVDRTWRPTP